MMLGALGLILVWIGFWLDFSCQNPILAAKCFAYQSAFVTIVLVKIVQINMNV